MKKKINRIHEKLLTHTQKRVITWKEVENLFCYYTEWEENP